MQLGDTVTMGDFTYRFDSIAAVKGANYLAERASFSVTRDGKPYTVLHPERRRYAVKSMSTNEAAIESSVRGDIYAVVGERAGPRSWTVRIYHQPLVLWIWLGGLLMALGGVVSLSDRRYRVGKRSGLLRAAQQARVGAAGRRLRPRLDDLVYADGHCRLARVARAEPHARRARAVRRPARRQRVMVVAIFRLAPRRACDGRSRAVARVDPRYYASILCHQPLRRPFIAAVSALGDIRVGTDVDGMAAQPKSFVKP